MRENDDTISNTTISAALARTSSLGPMIIMIIGSILLFVVAVGREIQVRVILERNDKYIGCNRRLNVVSAVLLSIGSLCIILMLIFDLETYQYVHSITAGIGIFFTIGYHLIHITLTFIALKNNTKLKNLFQHGFLQCGQTYFELYLLIPSWITGSFMMFAFFVAQLREDVLNENLDLNDLNQVWLEWVSYWILISMFGLFAVIFYRDPVNDEVNEFFLKQCLCILQCAICKKEKDKSNNEKNGMEMTVVGGSSA